MAIFILKGFKDKAAWKNPRAISKKGKREDLGGVYFRSKFEANVARYFNFLNVQWQYELKEFEFPLNRGIRFYTPDFYLPETDRWIEVKGWFDRESLVRLKRFKRYYPDEFCKLGLYVQRCKKEVMAEVMKLGCPVTNYGKIETLFSKVIPNWE